VDVESKISGSETSYRALSIDAKIIHKVESLDALVDSFDVMTIAQSVE
jgi:hypothetical protein